MRVAGALSSISAHDASVFVLLLGIGARARRGRSTFCSGGGRAFPATRWRRRHRCQRKFLAWRRRRRRLTGMRRHQRAWRRWGSGSDAGRRRPRAAFAARAFAAFASNASRALAQRRQRRSFTGFSRFLSFASSFLRMRLMRRYIRCERGEASKHLSFCDQSNKLLESPQQFYTA